MTSLLEPPDHLCSCDFIRLFTHFFAIIFVRVYREKLFFLFSSCFTREKLEEKEKSRVFSSFCVFFRELKTHFPSFLLIFIETMTKTSSEVQQQGDRIIKTTTTEGERSVKKITREFFFKKIFRKLIFF